MTTEGARGESRPAIRVRRPLFLKLGAATFAIVLLTLGSVLVIEYREERRAIEADTGAELKRIAATAALFLDGEAHQRIRTNDDSSGADFQRLKAVLARVQQANQLAEYDLTTLRRAEGGGLEFVLGLRETPIVETPYVPPRAIAPILDGALRTGVAGATPVYTDGFGTFVSAVAPIRDAHGQVVGLLEVDNDVSLVLARLRQRIARQVAIGAGALAAALLLTLVMARSLTRAIGRLVQGIAAVRAGRFDVQVEVQSKDEIGYLTAAFNEMLRGLRERLALLRFVPRHTRAAVAQAAAGDPGDGRAFAAQRRELALFFSDIRGFTALADELAPDRVIAMLDRTLRVEAEILERHGGSIDKFIGDAVMALFEGPERFGAAVAAAAEIQRALKRLNEENTFDRPIEVGIGIAGGEVLVGSVGDDERAELAVIGRLVNLASRLTSSAARGEILVSEPAFDALGGRFGGERIEGLKLKGFADGQVCYRVAWEGKTDP
jgi:class 3 adenylate cyclase